ncbi:MAG: PAS domain S-box protein [Desulfobacterales bacterium]|nr:PAS domain S-box protein [Desulfobacterales bacterium]
MKLFQYFHELGIRNKLLIIYSVIIFLAITLSSTFIYLYMKNTIEVNIENELQNSTLTILNMVRTAGAVSLKNYMRALAEKNRQISEYFYNQHKKGVLAEDDAKKRASDVILQQTIGKFGYIYCIDSNGIIVVHPREELRGVDISEYPFAVEQKKRKKGYLEYDWKNPGETNKRPKALYMTYFQPWDWIISVSSYREEFSELLNIDDFRESILSLRFGKTGYSYVIDTKGNLIIHPKLEQSNIYDFKDADGRYFIREICRRKSGKIIYSWKNPGETVHREKLVIFNYIPEFNWIVASSSYLEEFYAPLQAMHDITVIAIFSSLFLVLPFIIRISLSITNPLRELMEKIEAGADGNFSVRMKIQSQDEVGQLAAYFNSFMERLEKYSTSLKQEIGERKQAEQALKLSEEMFYKAFNSSPNAISISTLKDTRFINVNDSFLKLTGYAREEVTDAGFTVISLFRNHDDGYLLMETLKKNSQIRNLEIEFLTKKGESRTGVMSAEIIELWHDKCMLSNIADITETKRLEKEIMDSGEKERQRIGRDLHDDLCPHLIGIEVLAKVLNKKLENESSGEAPLADKIRILIKEAISKTRSLTRGLLPVYLVDHGLEASIKELAKNVEMVFGISCEFKYTSSVVFNDNTVATHLFYIIQEALHNAVKHSKADNILIDLALVEGKITVKIIDDGIGISDTADAKGMGLRIMGFRAKKIDASLDIRKNTGKGTTVLISFRKSPDREDMEYAR